MNEEAANKKVLSDKQAAHYENLRKLKEERNRLTIGYLPIKVPHVHPHNKAWGVSILTIEKGKVTYTETSTWSGGRDAAIMKAEEYLWEFTK